MLDTERTWRGDFVYHHGALLITGLLAALGLMTCRPISHELSPPSQRPEPHQAVERLQTAIEIDAEDELPDAEALLIPQVTCGPAYTFGQIYRL